MISIKMALEQATEQLKTHDTNARIEAEILLGYLLNKSRAFLYAHPEKTLESSIYAAYCQLIQRRQEGTPIAYLTGQREFWSLPLKVNQHTLIPRHETELLVELTLELLPEKTQARILDLGTGSGAIALALGKERPHWEIHACDQSEEALQVAKENATTLNIANIRFYHSNWFKALPKQHYHAIISNPPYIAEHDKHLSQGDTRFEPRAALVSGQKGLADLQYIIQESVRFLYPGGLLLLEHGFDQKNQLATILKRSGYSTVRCWEDISGNDRVSGGWYP